jgi:hypothetical protein
VQMGIFRHVIELNVCNGILTIPFKVKGTSSHRMSSPPEKIVRLPSIKSPETGRAQCIHFVTLDATEIIVAGKRDGEVVLFSTESIEEAIFEKKRQHQQQYIEFLRASHAKRVQKKVTNIFTQLIDVSTDATRTIGFQQ